MSNLSMPVMTFTNLDKQIGGLWRKRICYATTAERVNGAIYIKHHENVIAVIEPDSVYITHAGWESSTTANRLRHILRDNQIRFTLCIRQGGMFLMEPFKDRHGVPFDRATFERSENGWNLA